MLTDDEEKRRRRRFLEETEELFDAIVEGSGGAPNDQASDMIYSLYMKDNLSIAEIAERVCDNPALVSNTQEKSIAAALDYAFSYGQIDGDHHKTWVIDQMVRQLTGDGYRSWVKEYGGDVNEEGDPEYIWDTGVAP